jgi:hypothetical protein
VVHGDLERDRGRRGDSAGIFTGSVSLVAFGADSFIEVISAVALL